MEATTGAALDCRLEVRDHLDVDVPLGGRALAVSDMHLGPNPTPASRLACRELAAALDGWAGAGVVVLLGDFLELLEVPGGPGVLPDTHRPGDPAPALAAHDDLVGALTRFGAEPDRRVVYVVGNHDGRLAWDAAAARTVHEMCGAELCLTADLVFATGAGPRRVRMEHGHRFDPANSFADPRNPLDVPLGHHVVQETLPALQKTAWLTGIDRLSDQAAIPSFIGSRMLYRRVVRYSAWLAVPLLLALLIRVPLVVSLAERSGRAVGLHSWSRRLGLLAGGLLVDLALVAVTVAIGVRAIWRAFTGTIGAVGDRSGNDGARAEAEALVLAGDSADDDSDDADPSAADPSAAEGAPGAPAPCPRYWGLVTGHTHRAELRPVGRGFYANTGCCDEIVVERPSRLGLPPVWSAAQERSWIEMEAGAELRVRLSHARTLEPGVRPVERLAAHRRPIGPPQPTPVAEFPHGASWPDEETSLIRLRSVRRRAAGALVAAGLLDLASAVTPPLTDRLRWLLSAVPLAVPQIAAVAVALSGLGLLVLGRGVRRGQRRAWVIAVALLCGSVLLHVVKGGDLEDGAVAAVVAGYLIRHRSAFRARTGEGSARAGLGLAGIGAAVATAAGTAAAWLVPGHHPRLPFFRAVLAASERLVGFSTVPLPERLDDFLTPTLAAVGIGIVAICGWRLLKPAIVRAYDATLDDRDRARLAVERYGDDTLAYFALRDDKRWWFWRDSVVAYAVIGGVCLVSPDPVGPVGERAVAWDEFRRFVDNLGLTVAVLGVSEEWLPIYRRSGLRSLYVGDEAVVDCGRFTLSGSRMKSLRQAHNRIRNHGYTVRFFDPADLEPAFAERLRALSTESRRGESERGFSMTLGRLFDARDEELLLSVAFDSEGAPVAFCQFVPCRGIDGYSLDVMRRSTGEHPNGLLDFVLVETINRLKEDGRGGVALNFATLRAVLAGESGAGVTQRAERWLLGRMSGTMQIESLWHFNAKYDPDWHPRYAVYEAPGHLLPAAWAVAKAESFVELPLIGRMLAPKTPAKDGSHNAA